MGKQLSAAEVAREKEVCALCISAQEPYVSAKEPYVSAKGNI